MTILSNIQRVLSKFTRRKRLQLFTELMLPEKAKFVVDLGGNENLWKFGVVGKEQLIAVNTREKDLRGSKREGIKCMIADGGKLPFKDKSIDVLFSNAVIEHVGNREEQKQFANEIRRVAKRYFVTTPNKFFVYDPHYHMFFFHLIPDWLRKWIVGRFSIGGKEKGYFIKIRAIGENELKGMFPEARIIRTTLPFYPETLIAVKN